MPQCNETEINTPPESEVIWFCKWNLAMKVLTIKASYNTVNGYWNKL